MNKYVFLDIDGVLNSHDWYDRRGTFTTEKHIQSLLFRDSYELDPKAVALMAKFVREELAQVVISSSWRIFHPLDDINAYLADAGWKGKFPIGTTPRIHNAKRGDEVNSWLAFNAVTPYTYVIFDDDSDFHLNQPLVKTSYDLGLVESDLVLAKTYLEDDPQRSAAQS